MSQKRLKQLRKEKNKELGVLKEKRESILGVREVIKKNWKFLLLLLIGTVIIYFNGMHGDFVSDDYATIPQNPQIMSFSHALTGWMGGIINWFLAITFGVKSPIHFHIFSLLTYLTVLVTLFIFLHLIVDKRVAMVATVLFAVMPIHVETVSWIAGRPYLLNALFVLLSLTAFVYFLKTEKKKYLYSLLLLTGLAFFAEKSRFAALPLLAVLSWVVVDHELKKKISLFKIISVFGVLFLVVLLILWPQLINRIQAVNSGVNVSDSIFYNPFFQYPTAIAKYLQLIWAPFDLTLYHTMYIVPTWINWMILLTYLTTLVWFWFKDKKIFFALAFIFLAAAPSMAPVKISWLVAERYVFLGSAGFALFLAILFNKILEKRRILSLVFLIILVGLYSVRVFLRNIDWQTNHNLWVITCQVSPNSHNAWNNIGDDYDKLGQYENAIKGFTQSTVVKPNYADAFHNRANIFYKIGRLDLAQDSYRTALHFNPALYQTYLSLIQIDLIQKRPDLAMSDLAMYKKYGPNDIQTAYVEAVVNVQAGRKNEAKSILEQILRVAPDYVQAKNLYDSLKTVN